ncbi:RDD family protein [Dactylosporangium cerinum]|uniref:RDD family protein n=1 Tax=Dactylosporangium cerinum TaxID=1434730 RepID=A0ABV9VYI9_9ACTN
MTYPQQQPQHNPYAQPSYPQNAYGVPAQAYYGPPPVPLAPNGQPLAGFGLRLGAYLIDGAIFFVVSMAVMIPAAFGMVAWVTALAADVETDPETGQIVSSPDVSLFVLPLIIGYAAIFVIMVGLNYVYHVELYPSRRGVTLGKRALGLDLIRLDVPGAPITRGVAGKRWLAQYVGGIVLPFFNWIDGLWQLWDKPFQQCLHDKFAQTVVVKVNR